MGHKGEMARPSGLSNPGGESRELHERDRERTLENKTEKEFLQLGHQDRIPGEADPERSALKQQFSSMSMCRHHLADC